MPIVGRMVLGRPRPEPMAGGLAFAVLHIAILPILPDRLRRLLGAPLAAWPGFAPIGREHLFLRVLEPLAGTLVVRLDPGRLPHCPRDGSDGSAAGPEAAPLWQLDRQPGVAVVVQVRQFLPRLARGGYRPAGTVGVDAGAR